MEKKIFEKIYIAGVALILLLPVLTINRDPDAISEKENRPLTGLPKIIRDGSINKNLPTDIESYLDDRIGFRDLLISANALLQYHVFGRMEDGTRYRLGPDGEFNIVENDMVETYQHANLFSDEELAEITSDFKSISDGLKTKDCEFYYMQCWDKQSIYPEYFPDSVLQYGDISRTDQVLTSLAENTDVNVIPLKDKFISEKPNYEVYSKYGDPVHWTPRGALIGYAETMNAINEGRDEPFKVLTDDDFNITMTDQGMSFYGGVKRSNISESFERKETHAVMNEDYDEEHEAFDGYRTYHFTNENAGNDTKVLIICNSFIVNYLKEDFAESFGDTLVVWHDVNKKLPAWIEDYNPDIVIYEMVERYVEYKQLHKAGKAMRKAYDK
ncbi:hypothetical protein [Butyrivibrio sp. WCD3002]|uniref:hypothetical protein n=1 Tax=Butyrivibrio sp. WCD3002 TaxID=1280676 RepID=UPI0003F6A7C6|nr:hypothetical protein [Butyrivibrio sp. WCD3002]